MDNLDIINIIYDLLNFKDKLNFIIISKFLSINLKPKLYSEYYIYLDHQDNFLIHNKNKNIIKNIIISKNFNLINYFPNIRKIIFDDTQYSQKLKFPDYITEIRFSNNFKGYLDLILPASLEYLSLGNSFSGSINKLEFLNKLKYLDLGQQFVDFSNIKFPDSLTELVLNNFQRQYFPKSIKWPTALKTIKIGKNFDYNLLDLICTDNFEYLYLGYDTGGSGIYWNTIINKLPINLKYLELSNHLNYYYTLEINKYPENLTELRLEGVDQIIDCRILPLKLKKLIFGYQFNCDIKGLDLLINLEYLQFGWLYNLPLSCLPPNLKYLIFTGYFNYPVDNLDFPDSLIYLKLGQGFKQPIDFIDNIKNMEKLII